MATWPLGRERRIALGLKARTGLDRLMYSYIGKIVYFVTGDDKGLIFNRPGNRVSFAILHLGAVLPPVPRHV